MQNSYICGIPWVVATSCSDRGWDSHWGAPDVWRPARFNVCASLPHLAGTQKSSHSIRGSARVPARIHLTKQDGGRGDVCLTTAIAVPSIVVPTCGINDQSWSSYSGRSGLLITLVVCVRWCRSGAVSGKVRLTYIGWKLSGEETVGPGLYRGDWGWGAQSPGGV